MGTTAAQWNAHKRPITKIACRAMNRFRLACLLLSLVWVWATCSKNQGPRTDSETHFLSLCADGKCDNGLECIEQICTRTCESDSDCLDLYEGATCVEVKEECTGSDCQKVCDVPCVGATDCGSLNEALRESNDDSYICQSAFCRFLSTDAALPDDMAQANIIEKNVVFGVEIGRGHRSSRIVGDLDGDGLDDFVISDFGGTEGSQAAVVLDAAYLFYGREEFEDEILVEQADAILRDCGELYGTGKCDFDGDGLNDFVIQSGRESTGYPYSMNGAAAYLIYGNKERMSGDKIASELAIELLAPRAIAQAENAEAVDNTFNADCAGDLNGDGLDDFFVVERDSALSNAYVIYIVLGNRERLPDSFLLENADARIQGPFGNFNVGLETRSIGDTDNDGYDDLLVRFLPWSSGTPEAGLYYGGADRFAGDISQEGADAIFLLDPASIAGTRDIGDVNQDGIDDIAVGTVDNAVGIVYGRETRFSGILDESDMDLWLRLTQMTVPYRPTRFAYGDIDGDGLDDLLLGDPGYEDHGALFIIRGNEMPLGGVDFSNDSYIVQYQNESSFADTINADVYQFGSFGLSSGGDINGDGYDDILVRAGAIRIGDEYYDGVNLLFGSSIND